MINKPWLVSMSVKSDMDEFDYVDMVEARLDEAEIDYLHFEQIKSFMSEKPWLGQIIIMYFRINQISAQRAVEDLADYKEIFCETSAGLQGIECLGEYNPTLLQQLMQN